MKPKDMQQKVKNHRQDPRKTLLNKEKKVTIFSTHDDKIWDHNVIVSTNNTCRGPQKSSQAAHISSNIIVWSASQCKGTYIFDCDTGSDKENM